MSWRIEFCQTVARHKNSPATKATTAVVICLLTRCKLALGLGISRYRQSHAKNTPTPYPTARANPERKPWIAYWRGNSDGESDAAYLARLLAADGAQLFAAAFARATGGVGLLLAPQVHVGATEHAAVVEVTKEGPLSALAGATLDYDITLRNRGSVEATDVAPAAPR